MQLDRQNAPWQHANYSSPYAVCSLELKTHALERKQDSLFKDLHIQYSQTMNQLPLAGTHNLLAYSADYQEIYLFVPSLLANMLPWNWTAILIVLYVTKIYHITSLLVCYTGVQFVN
jgi:hypothetical protein